MALVTPEDVARMARELSAVAAGPAFLDLIQTIQTAPESEKLTTAMAVADIDTLVQHGISPPADFRITTRTFEDPSAVAESVSVPPKLVCDRNRIVFTFGGVVTVLEVIDDSD